MYKPLIETSIDAKRCRNRFEAFLRMFTRNYAYPLELMVRHAIVQNKILFLFDWFWIYFQLSDIQSSASLPTATFIYKINSIYNILQVAMSAYTTNARNYLDPGTTPPKIVDLLNSIRQTITVCIDRMLFHEDDYFVQVGDCIRPIAMTFSTFENRFRLLRCQLSDIERF